MLITPLEAAQKLGVSRAYIYMMMKRGKLTRYRKMGRVYVEQKEVDKLSKVRKETV